MLYYCKKCGRILFLFDSWERMCDYCKSDVYPVPERYLSSELSINENLKENFVNDYIKNSSEFDQNLFDSREENEKQHVNDFEKYSSALACGKAILEGRDKGNKFGVECPYCHATNVKKIGVGNRAISIGLFGFGSKKIGKQWHCNKCGSDF